MLKATGSHAAHLLMEAFVGLVGLVAIAGCVLAWRLGKGPIDITALVQRELYRMPSAGAHIVVGHAELAWEGFRESDSPIDIRWRDMVVEGVDGAPLARLPEGRVTLSATHLLYGDIIPRVVELDRPSVVLARDKSGVLHLNLAPAAGGTNDGKGGPEGAALLHDLARAPDQPSVLPFLSQLRHIRVRDADVALNDALLQLTWRAHAKLIDLKREVRGGVHGEGTLDLQLGPAHSTLTLRAELNGEGTAIDVQATPVAPAALATISPLLAPFAALDAPVQFNLAAVLSPSLTLQAGNLEVSMGAGSVQAGTGRLALDGATAALTSDGKTLHLASLRISEHAAPGAHLPPPVVNVTGDAARTADGWRASFAAGIDRASFADLASYWPAGVGGGARPWVTANITSGIAQNFRISGVLEAPTDFSRVALSNLAGGVDASDMTLYWLRPVPPLEHATARLTIDSADALHIDVPKVVQGPMAISAGRVGITGLSQKDQFSDIALTTSGSLKSLLDLLNHPRLHLLSRRPIPLNNPAGSVVAKLRVKLPLDAKVTFDQIGISANAKLTSVHLGAIAAGRDLDDGVLDLAVDTNALKITGTGKVGGVPADLAVDMDFRVGPPSQVLEHYAAHGSPTAAQLTAAGMPCLTAGSAALDVDYATHRDGSGDLALNADLRNAAIATPFGCQKETGKPANAAARVRLQGDRLAAIDVLRADGPGLQLDTHARMQPGQPRTLVLDKLVLGRTQANGSITLAQTKQDRLRVKLRGPALDLSAYLKQRDTATSTAQDDDKPGQAWDVDLAFDRVILAQDETLAPASFTASNDGVRLLRADLAAGANGQVRLRIQPTQGGRSLTVDSADAGAVLLAAGVADNIRGGRLRLNGSYNDTIPHSPLSGTATLESFRIIDAPAIGRLLKAMTLYGAVDLLRGPGLGFQKAVVPFRWQQRVLHLDSARAFSASLGLTAQGDIDLRQHRTDVTGTIVPAYFFNQLLGRIPLLGVLFSPEKGGGVFAARYSVKGPLKDPKVGVNALSALTPGFLREVFGLF
jgi:hypothetical protein